MKKSAAVIKGVGGVVVIEVMGLPACLKSVGKIHNWEHREAFKTAFERAATRLGFKRDRRCQGGWRKIAA